MVQVAKVSMLVILGAIVGAVVSVILMRSLAPEPRDLSRRASTEGNAEGKPVPGDQAALDEISRRLRSLEAAQHSESKLTSATVPGASGLAKAPSNRGAAEVRNQFQSAVAMHNAEAVDRAWAQRTSVILESDIAQASKGLNMKVGKLDCRTTTCMARVEWTSRGNASNEYTALLHHSYRANCGRSVLIDDEPGANGKATGTLLMNCEQWRSEGEELTSGSPTIGEQSGRPVQ